jgi:aspartyl/glutamyl-tRNA(Asn/Gln) amidotransferase C subunit
MKNKKIISVEEVKRIADLAKIGLENQTEIKDYQEKLSTILDYFSSLQKLDLKKTEPIGHISGIVNVLREDKSQTVNQLQRKIILKNAPRIQNNFFQIDQVL